MHLVNPIFKTWTTWSEAAQLGDYTFGIPVRGGLSTEKVKNYMRFDTTSKMPHITGNWAIRFVKFRKSSTCHDMLAKFAKFMYQHETLPLSTAEAL